VNEGKVGRVESVVQIVEIVVDLRRGKLTLVNDVGWGEGTDVESLGETDLVGSLLSENVQLSLKVFGVKFTVLTFLARTVVRFENDERLPDLGLSRSRRRTENRVVAGNISPSQGPHAQSIGDLFERGLLSGEIGCRQEHVSDGVESFVRNDIVESVGGLSDKELVGDTGHDTSTITISGIGTG
jgi:hypothetical protein